MEMRRAETRFGPRWHCIAPGCDIASWNKPTSTPADDETRELRRQCHEKFDRLWGPHRRFRSRNAAYRWLQQVMRLPREKAHIGMMDLEACCRFLKELEKLKVPQ
jgi:hypothetical protein